MCHNALMFEDAKLKIQEARIIPVVKIVSENDALAAAEKVLSRGLSSIEVTFRSLDGTEGFKKIARGMEAVRKEFPQVFLGAGTVINPELAKMAMDSGAQFMVSPGFNFDTVDFCIGKKIPLFPGVCNPSQVEWALNRGLDVLKFFPAELSGGIKMLKALSGPFPHVKFIPTGGINGENFNSYLECQNVLAVGGTWVID